MCKVESPYKVNKLAEHFWAIEERGVFMYLIEGDERAMLVDTGFGTGDLGGLVKELTKKPLIVVITHADPDHVGGCKYFGEIYMHPSDFSSYYGRPENNEAILPIWEGEKIDLGGKCFEVVLIPGHTPGSIVLIDRENRMMFGGDTFQYGSIFMFGPNRNFRAFEASVKKASVLKDSIDSIYPGHDKYPISSQIIDDLLEGLEILKTNTVTGKETEGPFPAKLYECGKVRFLKQDN